MPPGPSAPASMPMTRKISSSGAPKRRAITLEAMPTRTSAEAAAKTQ
jgi:hypothetical protein